MGKFGVKERNLEGQMVVDFAKRMDMAVVNTYFQKREEHRVTYESGGRSTQVDYVLCRRGNLKYISDCKVVVGESVVKQHRMVVCRMTLMVCKKKRSKIEIEKKTKWWKLKKEECCEELRQKFRKALGGQVVLSDDWETTAEVIRETGRKVLGVSSGRRKEDKETWWWNEEVQDSIQRKRLAKKKWDRDRTEENRQKYKESQCRVKREVSKAKQKAYDELYTSPMLFTLLTHDCTPKYGTNLLVKFTDDMTVDDSHTLCGVCLRVEHVQTALEGAGCVHCKVKLWATAKWEWQSAICTSYDAFSRELRKVFDTTVPQQGAMLVLFEMCQGSRSVTEYAVEFHPASVNSGWNVSTLHNAFYHRLATEVKDELTIRELPSELDKLITLASHIDPSSLGSCHRRAPSSSIPTDYHDLGMVFCKARASLLPPHCPYTCSIDLLPGTLPPRGCLYHLTMPEMEAMNTYIRESIIAGIISPSSSPAGVGFFFIEKKAKTLCACIDYWGLNVITVKNRYPLPLMSSAFELLQGATVFTKLYLWNAYHLGYSQWSKPENYPAPPSRVGQRAWLSTRDLPLKVTRRKFTPHFIGPFPISKVLNPVAVWLPMVLRIYPTFHISRLKPIQACSLPLVVTISLSSGVHLQSSGQTKWLNQNWRQVSTSNVVLIEYAHNFLLSATMGLFPIQAAYGCQLLLFSTQELEASVTSAIALVRHTKWVLKQVKTWPAGAISVLQDCFECTDWDMFREAATHGETTDLEEYTSSVTSYIGKCIDEVTVSKPITTRPNQKPWMNAKVRALLKFRDSAFRAGDKDTLRIAWAKLSRAIWEAKHAHSQRIHGHFQSSGDTRRMWQGIQSITNYMR
ncbi:hypothetical protein QTP86_008714 [Hemibagrus guttatus]|nr:hypothetical protein QTP86_008714 [Hemibagrus guttatus]